MGFPSKNCRKMDDLVVPQFRKPPCGKERPSHLFKRSQLGSRTFCSSALCDCHGALKRSLKGQPNQIHKDFDGSRPRMGLSEEKKGKPKIHVNFHVPSKLSYLGGCYSGAPPILRQARHTSNICNLERNRNVKKKNDTPNAWVSTNNGYLRSNWSCLSTVKEPITIARSTALRIPSSSQPGCPKWGRATPHTLFLLCGAQGAMPHLKMGMGWWWAPKFWPP